MTTSPTGWNAIFKPWREEPVVGWDESGYPLIVNAETGKRVDVHDLEDHEFCNLERAAQAFVGVLPADGAVLDWGDGSDDRIFGFGIQANGILRPLIDSHHGYAAPFYPEESARPPRIKPRPRS